MKRLLLVVALLAAVASCTSDSALPTPTGKGTIRAINAIVGSPGISFRIEEQFLGSVDYKGATGSNSYDDFNYNFNFDTLFLGDLTATRIATFNLKIDANRDYSLVISGDIMNPVITVWEDDERDWDGTETVFETRFSHASVTMGDIDVYFALVGTAPAIGEERGSLSFGEILPSLDLEEGVYVITVTGAGNLSEVLYVSDEITFAAQVSAVVTFFDGDESNTARYVARGFSATAGTIALPDITALPTIRFIQASLDLLNSDVYDDEMLNNLVLSDHAFRDATDDIELPIATTIYTYTTVGDTSAVLFESGIGTAPDSHFNFLVIGEQGARFAITFIPDRRSVTTIAKIRPYHAALNNNNVDFYVVDTGVSIDEELPALNSMFYSLPSPTLAYDTGSYDMYVTIGGEKTILAGPVQIDVVLGDVIEIYLVDNTDPAVVDLLILPTVGN